MTQSYLPSRWYISTPQFANDPDIFPLLPGFSFITAKEPTWSTGVQQATSGRERRRQQWSYPIWSFKVAYEVLRDAPMLAEQQKLLAFFNSKAGMFQEFFFFDPSDNAVSAQPFGTGDGSTTTFQLTRSITGGAISFTEPVRAVAGTPTVRVNGAMVGAPLGKNLLQWSEDLTNSVWTKDTLATVTGNTAVAPDGTTTADTVTDSSTAQSGEVYEFVTIPNNTLPYTASLYVKKAASAGPIAMLGVQLLSGSGAISGCYFDPFTGATQARTPGDTFAASDAGSYWRISATVMNDHSGNVSCGLFVMPAYSSTLGGAQNNALTGSLTVWGAQVEQSSGPTPYVPTTSAAGDYSINPLGQITFNAAPANSAVLTWTGQFMFLVRFADDKLTAQQMMQGLWSVDGINLIGVKA